MPKASCSSSDTRVLVLLSGGLDSSTVLYFAKAGGYDVTCLSIAYGQKHSRELEAAEKIALFAKTPVRHLCIELPWGGSSLTDPDKKIPVEGISGKIPSTYVPGRNTIFIAFALSLCESEGIPLILVGANAVDFSGYPDCRTEYYTAMNALLARASLGKVRIEAPLMKMTKKEIVLLAKKLNVPLELTWSCYKGENQPCMKCDSCRLRAKGFRQAGIKDPALGST